MNKYYVKYLPSGNESQFSLIDEQLNSKGISFEFRALRAGGGIYRIPEHEMHKLPVDEGEPYLPVTDDAGHSIYLDINNDMWENMP